MEKQAGFWRTLARWNRTSHRLGSGIVGHGLAIVSVAIAVGMGVAMQAYGFRPPPTALVSLRVAVATWYGGIGPAVTAVVLSIPSFIYFFAEPAYAFDISARDLPYCLVFVL